MFNKWIFILSLATLFFTLSCEDPASKTNDTEKPTVSITNPMNNVEYSEGIAITITVQASDNEGIKEVNFYIDDNLVSTVANEPYEYYWDTSGFTFGQHQIKANAVDVNDNISDFKTVTVSIIDDSNIGPIAKATVSQAVGNFATAFQFDASASTDAEDALSALQVRWDWNNDGTWDTDYALIKTAAHQYTSAGFYWVKAGVKDTGGKTDNFLIPINVITNEMGSVTDVDGTVYQTAKIGNQWWMVENLKTTHYRNGDEIPEVTDNTAWSALTSGARFEADSYNYLEIYGLLYNGYVVGDSRNIAPVGWHVATDNEWKELELYIGLSEADTAKYNEFRGMNEMTKLFAGGNFYWSLPDAGPNESGFTALPGGGRAPNGDIEYYGSSAYFWTATEKQDNTVWSRYLTGFGIDRTIDFPKGSGMNIRCVRD